MTTPAPRITTVLVYSSNPETRQRIIGALGDRPTPDIHIVYAEATTGREVVARCDVGDIDVTILDGEAAPTGGMGLARQLKDELNAPPLVLLIVGRRDDAWLATWSRAEAVTHHPIDAVRIADAFLGLVGHRAGVVTTGG
jgi:DNA-binding LytR/AlgR family response regulator